MVKVELERLLRQAIAEREALRSELSKLRVQLIANNESTTLGDIKAAMAAAKAEALRTGKCVALRR